MRTEYISSDVWHETIASHLNEGERFGTMYATSHDLRCVLIDSTGQFTTLSATYTSAIASIVDLTYQATWAEREAHDLYGITFLGHDPLRPLVNHTDPWTVPVSGVGLDEVAVGPIHAGVIESGHFRLHTAGERILLLDLRLFYKHRGLERAAEGRMYAQALPYIQRACAGCAVSNTLAFALACEARMGLTPSPSMSRQRMLLLELERLWNHLNDLSAVCAGVGFAAGSMGFAALKEQAQRLNATIFGHRFLFGTIAIGTSQPPLDANAIITAHKTFSVLKVQTERHWLTLQLNGSFQDRLGGVGVISRHDAQRFGAVGPVARASGINNDVRQQSPFLEYHDFIPSSLTHPTGDVAARIEIRYHELLATLDLLESLITLSDSEPSPPATKGPLPSRKEAVSSARVESPRGETICCVEGSATALTRVHLKTSSYANWPVVGEAVPGNVLGDFPLINKSFELCYACVDR